MLEAIVYKRGELRILDQRQIPKQMVYLNVESTEEAWTAIKNMNVRGAPAIAIVALLSLNVELSNVHKLFEDKKLSKVGDKIILHDYIVDRCAYLCTSRPTAVNVAKECQKVVALCKKLADDQSVTFNEMLNEIMQHNETVFKDDVSINKAIGDYGAKHIMSTSSNSGLNILTHCNTGSLATAGYGTALGVIWSLNSMGALKRAYCTETRPYNQGARLTAFELLHEKVNATLICDNMVSALMKHETVNAVVVGADRVVANGDTANKIGTYQIAVSAKHHNVPFYVASPLSTIDFSLSDGSLIPIEERPAIEMKSVEEIHCWNPAFDITPSELITGIITEVGVFKPNELHKIKDHFK
ncbi:methylthioribose-1-phosphate isomerase-like protein [Dinothrombium tinctorium]|uniref:Methylthioribose-1-phosphate isomerase n=1 Tax=Dinothrombium tinctorium TaxID=1965070 RepID=A0A3S3PFW9_9ACAR|nr:methylthioribose-1-phosphate isomerase-like protein [Dinothrombium tinctorium]